MEQCYITLFYQCASGKFWGVGQKIFCLVLPSLSRKLTAWTCTLITFPSSRKFRQKYDNVTVTHGVTDNSFLLHKFVLTLAETLSKTLSVHV